jgi:CcmD family protein
VKKYLRWAVPFLLVLILVSIASAQGQPPAQPPPGFVPAEQVPESELIPAINLVAAAYGFVWIALVGYVLSLVSRLKKVEREIGQLERKGR